MDLQEQYKRLAEEVHKEDKASQAITDEEWAMIDGTFFRFARELPWYAALAFGMRRVFTKQQQLVPTAAIGWLSGQPALMVNINFFKSLTVGQRQFVLAHEIEHFIRNHISVMLNNPEKAEVLNFCMDAIINTALEKNVFRNKNDWRNDKLITYQKAKELHQAYLARNPATPPFNWDKVGEEKFMNDALPEELIKLYPSDCNGEDPIKQIIQDLVGEFGEFFDDGSVVDDLKEIMIENLMEEASKSAGNAPEHVSKIAERFKDKANREWRKLVRGVGYSTKHYSITSWAKMNRKLPWLRPGRYHVTRPRVLCVIDRSGSVGPQETIEFKKELNCLVNYIDLDLIFVDAAWDPANPDTFVKNVDNVDKVWKSWVDIGGGTNFNDVYDYLLKGEGKGEYQTVILLTDGFLYSNPYIPDRLGTEQNILILTPNHDESCKREAMNLGFSICIIEDKKSK